MAGALRLWPPEIQRAPLEPRAAAHPRASEPLNGAKERKRTPHTQSPGTVSPGSGRGGDVVTSSLRPTHASTCSSVHLPAHWARDGAFLWGHVPAFLSSAGLKARAGRFPFMYKGPLIQNDERRAAWGKEVTPALPPSAGRGGRPQGILPAGGPAQQGSGPHPGHRLHPPPDPWDPSLKACICLCAPPRGGPPPRTSPPAPVWSNSSFPKNASAAGLDSPGTSQGPGDWTSWAQP